MFDKLNIRLLSVALAVLPVGADPIKINPDTGAPFFDKIKRFVNDFAGLILVVLGVLFILGVVQLVQGVRGEREGGWKNGAALILASVLGIWFVNNNSTVITTFTNYIGGK